MRKINRKLFAISLISVLLVSCAKNPFSTRDTETPYGSAGTWETPQSPDVTLRNLLFAYNEMIISNYQLCFSDSFSFSSPEDSIDAVNNGNTELFGNWNKSVEVATAGNLFSIYAAADSLDLYLTLTTADEYADVIEDTTAIMYRTYSLILIETGTDTADTTIAEGLATFHLDQEQLNWWTVTWWGDIPGTSGGTDWGDIKAEFRR